jgi:hypothetical protein
MQRLDVVFDLVRSNPDETAALAGLASSGGAFVSTTFPHFDDAGRGVRTVKVFTRSGAVQLVARVRTGELEIDVAWRRAADRPVRCP